MKIKPEFFISYDEDDICILRREADGSAREVSPISASAAMAWECIERGMTREAMIEAIITEFGGADPEQVTADLDALTAQLLTLGYAEE